jgi:hypothetical protein
MDYGIDNIIDINDIIMILIVWMIILKHTIRMKHVDMDENWWIWTQITIAWMKIWL